MSMCSGQAYWVKALHGMLPTAARLYITCPDLYHDDLCPHCLEAAESGEHLLQCSYTAGVIGEVIS